MLFPRMMKPNIQVNVDLNEEKAEIMHYSNLDTNHPCNNVPETISKKMIHVASLYHKLKNSSNFQCTK